MEQSPKNKCEVITTVTPQRINMENHPIKKTHFYMEQSPHHKEQIWNTHTEQRTTMEHSLIPQK